VWEFAVKKMKVNDERRIGLTHTRFLGLPAESSLKRRIILHNEVVGNILRDIKCRDVRWVEHVAGMLEMRNADKILVGKRGGK
jgi:hypothetical protein